MSDDGDASIDELLKEVSRLRQFISSIDIEGASKVKKRKFVDESGALINELQNTRERVSPVQFGAVRITLGRSDSIAKFFAFSFVNQEMEILENLDENPFFGSGVYALYYCGDSEAAYRPISGSETPIYVGKANPFNSFAETVEDQGQAIFKRLKEHAKNIEKTNLKLSDFKYRYAAIQTGMQVAVEEFMIRLFRPIWNKEVKICFGIGKHGDNAKTRANKRSPWDTMHPGRSWAEETAEDQMPREKIEEKLKNHFQENPVFSNKEDLFGELSL